MCSLVSPLIKILGVGLYRPDRIGLETPEKMGACCCPLGEGEGTELSLESALHHRERS